MDNHQKGGEKEEDEWVIVHCLSLPEEKKNLDLKGKKQLVYFEMNKQNGGG